LAAAALGSSEQLDLIEVDSLNRFSVLQSGEVDVLASSDTVTMERDVSEVSACISETKHASWLILGPTDKKRATNTDILKKNLFLHSQRRALVSLLVSRIFMVAFALG